MLSRSSAAILLFLALAVAAFGGGYLALQTFGGGRGPFADEELRALRLEVDALQENPAAGEPAPGGAQTAVGRGMAGVSPGAAAAAGGSEAPARPAPIPRAPVPPPPTPAAAGSGGPGPGGAGPGTGGGAVEVARTYEEVMVRAGEILDVQLQSPLSSETAKVEDVVEARITKDVRGGNYVAIPAGTKILGSVVDVDRGNAISSAARIDVRFHTVVTRDGGEVAVNIDPLTHVGPSPSGDSKAKIGGGAAAGAALGWLKGGLGGAIRGGALGGGAGTAVKMVEGRRPAELPAGAQARVELRAPIFVTILK